jgi:hypothetical protein
MAIQSNASTCSDAQNPLAQAIVGGQKAGGFAAFRAVTHEDVGTRSAVDVTGDYSASIAFNIGTSVFPFHPMASLPPPGTCTVYSVTGDLLRGDPLPGSTPNGKPLDFGPVFTITGPNGTQMATSVFSSARVSYHGGSLSNNLIPKSLYLDPGSYTITGLGGKDIGAFTASFTTPQSLTWTNRDQLTVVPRSQPLALSWAGGSPDQWVGIVGFGEDLPTNASTVFACLAPPGANNLIVPANMLSNLPPTRANVLQSKSVLYLVSLPRSSVTKLNASGLDAGAAGFVYVSGKTVVWQ